MIPKHTVILTSQDIIKLNSVDLLISVIYGKLKVQIFFPNMKNEGKAILFPVFFVPTSINIFLYVRSITN